MSWPTRYSPSPETLGAAAAVVAGGLGGVVGVGVVGLAAVVVGTGAASVGAAVTVTAGAGVAALPSLALAPPPIPAPRPRATSATKPCVNHALLREDFTAGGATGGLGPQPPGAG